MTLETTLDNPIELVDADYCPANIWLLRSTDGTYFSFTPCDKACRCECAQGFGYEPPHSAVIAFAHKDLIALAVAPRYSFEEHSVASAIAVAAAQLNDFVVIILNWKNEFKLLPVERLELLESS